MSQEKVDRYKKEKANRKKVLARNRVKRICGTILGWVILAALVGWAGYAGYQYYEKNRPVETFYCDTSVLDDYIAGLAQ